VAEPDGVGFLTAGARDFLFFWRTRTQRYDPSRQQGKLETTIAHQGLIRIHAKAPITAN
jgi:hypothetical protein